MSDQYTVAYLGNFEPEFSTENDYARAFVNNGHTVQYVQEGDPQDLAALIADIADFDFVLWTRTFGLAARVGDEAQWKLLAEARRHKVPVVGVHLDRWWGLPRLRPELLDTPYARVDLLLTADGGHQPQWEGADVNHRWLPPGVSEKWCRKGNFRQEYACEVAFVGSWQGGYHKEWAHRYELVNWLDRNYGDSVKFFPRPGKHAIRGLELNDVYWSAKVVVGDSCLVPKADGTPMTHYCSDRIPETLGRGGILIHPEVEGVTDFFGGRPSWELWNWDDLRQRIEDLIALSEVDRTEWRQIYIDRIVEYDTYEKRVPQIIDHMKEAGLL